MGRRLLLAPRLVLVALAACALATAGARETDGDVVVLDDSSFEHDTQASSGSTTGSWFVLLYAPWCGHCKSLHPTWKQLATKLKEDGGDVNVAQVDCTQNPRTQTRFQVRGFPTLVLLRKGKVYKYTGPRSLEALAEFVQKPTGDGEAIPAELGFLGEVVAQLDGAANEIWKLSRTKTGPVVLIAMVGFFCGVMGAMALFVLCLERERIVYKTTAPSPPPGPPPTETKKDK